MNSIMDAPKFIPTLICSISLCQTITQTLES